MQMKTVKGINIQMKKLLAYIKLMRPKHYLKNGLVLVPLFFDMNFFDRIQLLKILLGFFSFSFLSSIIYIINDINDIESDRQSEKKRKRPLAAGTVKKYEAIILVFILSIAVILLELGIGGKGAEWLVIYFVLNLAYSLKLKQVPIIDVAILASGFLIRLLYGAAVTDISISFWLCMTVVAFSFYMGLGKRRNELQRGGDRAHEIRGVLKNYNSAFLDKNMYMCLGLAIAFYALWSGADATIKKLGTDMQMWTVPLVILLAMKYSLNIEKEESGDPMEVILNDKWLIIIGIIYIITLFGILYVL